MSKSFINDTSLEELKDLLERTPLQVIMKAFHEVDDADIAVFLLLLDVASGKTKSDSSEEIRRTLVDDDASKEDSGNTLSDHAQHIFAQFPIQRQVRITELLAVTEMVDTQQAEQIWEDLIGKMKGTLENTMFFGNSAKNIAKFLSQVDIQRQNQLMDALEKKHPQLTNSIADSLFTFEDLAEVPDDAIITLLQVLEKNTLALALYDAPTVIQDRFYNNMTAEKAESIEEETEQLTFEQKQLCRTAQQSVVSMVRNFAAKGLLKIR